MVLLFDGTSRQRWFERRCMICSIGGSFRGWGFPVWFSDLGLLLPLIRPSCCGMWEWQGDEYSLQRNTRNEFSHLFWDEVCQNEDDLLYMLDEHTPIKDCADLGHQVSDVGDETTKGLEECKDSNQLKRRRTLQFTTDTNEAANDQMTSTVFKSKLMESSMMEDGISESLECTTQWTLGFSDDRSAINSDGLDQSSDGWLVDYLNESETHYSPDEKNNIVAFNQQVDISEFYHDSPAMETDMVPETPAPAHLKFFNGKMSYIKGPKKLTTSIAYPFALIKPCGVHGDVTLKDINQRILAPLPSKSKLKKDEDPSISYPTSAFSGKPVVVKTKIRTEGGQGSITIMRTKG
uniref:Protein XRI1 n=1 Tax=Musa acuminata subsp. malaccensis TaxID=214687 RepID=A0A804K1H7_MUSAM|nr:PREDICTED: protein XRI1 isoform X4 [Musa acuminata subsp. malaccensis]